MTDSHLRDLERRFLQSGSPDDEAAYLLERVRVGDLTHDRLALAADCGHEGARRAVVGEAVTSHASLWEWVSALRERWPDAVGQAARIGVGRCLALSREKRPDDHRLDQAIVRLQRFLAEPTEQHRAALEEASLESAIAGNELSEEFDPQRSAAHAVRHYVILASGLARDFVDDPAFWTFVYVGRCLGQANAVTLIASELAQMALTVTSTSALARVASPEARP